MKARTNNNNAPEFLRGCFAECWRNDSMRKFGLIFLTMLIVVLSVVPVAAQDDGGNPNPNLLQDPSFESAFTGRGRPDLNLPAGWNIFIATTPRNEVWQNLEPVAFPHTTQPEIQDGNQSLNINRGFATFTVAVYQQVSVPEGASVRGRAWAWLQTCDIPDNADTCDSSPEFNAFTRVGIDPNGGTNPNDADVVWSEQIAPHNQWGRMRVDATATAGTVTLFLFATQQWPAELNNVWWDNALLRLNDGEGSDGNEVVEPPAFVPFVTAQGPAEDGSIVHVVQPGDTIDSIAVAYGVTRDDILALNDIADARFIFVGQELTIREAQTNIPAPVEEQPAPPQGQQQQVQPSPPLATAPEGLNAAIARQALDMFNGVGQEAVGQLFAPTFEWHGSRDGTGTAGSFTVLAPDGWLEGVVNPVRQVFPDLVFTIDNVVEENNYVTVQYTAVGTFTNDWPSGLNSVRQTIPANGEQFALDGIFQFRIDNGQITSAWHYWGWLWFNFFTQGTNL